MDYDRHEFSAIFDYGYEQLENQESIRKEDDFQKPPSKTISDYQDLNLSSFMSGSIKHDSDKIAYYFVFNIPNCYDYWFEKICLANSGNLEIIDRNNIEESEDLYFLYEREQAIAFLEKCNDYVKSIHPDGGYFSVALKKLNNPSRIFSENDIRKIMVSADDRVDNKMVIDENGRSLIIQKTYNGRFYPVELETFVAGNVYVGKYADLENIQSEYIRLLEGYLLWVEHGYSGGVEDSLMDMSVEELTEKIRALII